MGGSIFDESKRKEQYDGEDKTRHYDGVAPTGHTGIDQSVHQTHQSTGEGRESRPIRSRGMRRERFVHLPPGEGDGDHTDGNINEEDTSPVDLAGDHAAENWPECDGNSGDRSP